MYVRIWLVTCDLRVIHTGHRSMDPRWEEADASFFGMGEAEDRLPERVIQLE